MPEPSVDKGMLIDLSLSLPPPPKVSPPALRSYTESSVDKGMLIDIPLPPPLPVK